jgi:hypothetical protein
MYHQLTLGNTVSPSDSSKFQGSHVSDCSDYSHLGGDTIQSYMKTPMFQRNILPPFSGKKCVGQEINSLLPPLGLTDSFSYNQPI